MSKSNNELARLLDAPALARVVPHLPPETLHAIIQHHGLDASAELMVLATPTQLTSLADLDLWRSAAPGLDGHFDVDRFGEWVESLVNISDSVAAKTIANLDANIAIAGFSRYLRVMDPGIFEPIAQSDDEAPDRHELLREGDVIDSGSDGDRLECEVGGYIIRARRTDAWDAMVTLLVTLDDEQREYFHRVMQGCRDISNSDPEYGGFHDLLLEHQQQLQDVADDRERRRSQQGYATPADARAFLQMARQPAHMRAKNATDEPIANPIVAAYFWAADEAIELEMAAAGNGANSESTSAETPESLAAVVELLTDAGMMPGAPRALLGSGEADPKADKVPQLRRLMEEASRAGDVAFFARHRELAFLANALLAGCSLQSRPFTQQEAADAAASICNLGLELIESSSQRLPDEHVLVTAFEMGWAALYQEVSLPAVDQLIAMLADVSEFDRDIRRELVAFRKVLIKQRDAGTPWLARASSDVLSMLDVTAATAVLGLLDECPILPAALTAVLDGRLTSVSPTAFDFIATEAQLIDIRSFLSRLSGAFAP